MFISNKDLILLSDIAFYLNKLEGEVAQELSKDLSSLIEKLEIQRVSKNVVNTKRIMEKRKTDKNYARPLKDKEIPLF